ncbi:MAG: hypothetical protein ACXWIU_12815 [Limisphaerales bacterium]
MQPDRNIWFPAKKYGWGWGPPRCWQGWAVIVGWLVADVVGIAILPPDMWTYYVFIACMVIILITICFIKGEKPKWRWGNK